MKLLTHQNGRIREQEVDVSGSVQETTKEEKLTFFISGNFIAAGDTVTLYLPNGGRIDGYAIHTDTPATVQLDIRATSPETLPSQEADSICGTGAKPELSSSCFNSDTTLSGWERLVDGAKVLAARVVSVTGDVRNITLQFDVLEPVEGYPLVLFTAPEESEIYLYTSPTILYGAEDVEEFPTYIHTTEIERTPELLFGATDVEEYPTYVHTTELDVTPQLLFGASDIEEYPTYVQADPAPFVFDAGTDDNVNQWVKYSRTFSPTSGAPGYSYVVTGLPTGLVATTENGVLTISGIPEVTGTFAVGIEVTDRIGRVISDSYSIILSAANRTPVIENTIPHVFVYDVAGGTGVLAGYNFNDTSALQLLINDVDYTANIVSFTDTEILFTVPTGITSPGSVKVVAFGQTSNIITIDFV